MAGADLMVVANTGDDFEHLGLAISPDLDTIMYTLAGLDDPQRGWGRRDETWIFMAALEALGGETWFRSATATSRSMWSARDGSGWRSLIRHHRRFLPPLGNCRARRADD